MSDRISDGKKTGGIPAAPAWSNAVSYPDKILWTDSQVFSRRAIEENIYVYTD